MSYAGFLNLVESVQVARETITMDGMGSYSAATVLTTLNKAAIWQIGAGDIYLSEQQMQVSTHVLACQADDDVLFTDKIVYDGNTYEVTGRPDDVFNKGRVKTLTMKLIN